MKKLLSICAIALMVSFVLTSCHSADPNTNVSVEKQGQYVNGKDYTIVRIDKCQYIKYHTWIESPFDVGLIHKGDCDNPIHVK